MDTLHPVLKRGLSIWDRERLPREEFDARLDAVRRRMKSENTDLLLVYGDSFRYGNLAYLSHFLPKNRGALAVLPQAGEPALIVKEPSRNNPFSRTLTWIEEVSSLPRFDRGVQEFLKKRALSPKAVGLAGVAEQLGAAEAKALGEAAPGARVRDGREMVEPLRLVKSARELALLRKAAALADQAVTAFQEECRAGHREYQAAAAAERAARLGGAEDVRVLLARGSEPAVGLHPADDSPFAPGDCVLLHLALSFQRYWTEVGRTVCLGKVPGETRSAHDRLREIQSRLVQELGGGKAAGAAVRSAAAGIPGEILSSLGTYGLGNGLGLDPEEAPVLAEDNRDPLQAGETLTIRLCAHGPGIPSALLARSYEVTGAGLKPLTNFPPEVLTC